MPDTWTTNPPKLREMFTELGAPCGVEARVLKPRDKYWTCHVDSKGWLRDVYIHPVHDMFSHGYILSFLVLAAAGGVMLGLLWGKYFWKEKAS